MPALHKPTSSLAKRLTDIIGDYERGIRDQHQSGYELTIRALDDFAKLGANTGFDQLDIDSSESLHWYTRFASAVLSWAFHPQTDLDSASLAQLCLRKRIVVAVFDASGFCGTAVVLAVAPKAIDEANGKTSVQGKHLKIAAAMTSVNSVPEALLEYIISLTPDQYFPFLLGWLNERIVSTKLGEENRTKLLRSAPKLEGLTYDGRGYVNAVNTSWMYCSYASTPDKHEFKRHLNKLIVRYAHLQLGRTPLVATREKKTGKKKPKLIVVNEYLHARHAMYRCYEKGIRSLSDYFEVVGVCDKSTIDESGKKLFSSVILFHNQSTLKELVARIEEEKADVIYYPSVGMSPYITCLVNLRLAPLQVAGQGHPATTMSPHIDFVIVSQMQGDLSKVYSEKVAIYHPPSNEPQFSPSSEFTSVPKRIERNDKNTVIVGVNSKVFKLNYRLIDICKRLSKLSARKIIFRFFTGETGVLHDGLMRHLEDQIADSEVYPAIPYPKLLSKMADCEICLSAFPFGNTNGTVDACLLGIPTVAHFGPEHPAQTDRIVLEYAGFPLETVAYSDEEYFDIALRLLQDQSYRDSLRAKFPSHQEVRLRLYGADEKESRHSFGKFLRELYEGKSTMGEARSSTNQRRSEAPRHKRVG